MPETKEISVLLADLENRVEAHLHTAIQTFQNLKEHELLKKTSEQGWSITECLWHLNSYGHFYLPQIQKRLQTASVAQKYKSGWLGAYFTKMMKPNAGKGKMKAFKDHIPPAQLNATAVVAEFIEQQELLLKYIRLAHHANLHTRLPISISKWITLKLGDVLQFLVAHDERHIQQALRNLS